MEESAQRRERLKAMRMEASQEATNNDASAHSAVTLSNPLIDSTANPESQAQPFAQSFNYYTDPMAAYSGNKQGSKVTSQRDYSSTPTRPWSNETSSSPSLQSHMSHSPNPRMQQPQGHYSNASHYTPNALQGGNFPNPNHNFQGRGWNTNSPRPGGYRGPGNFGYSSPQPHFTSGPGQGGYASPGPGPGSSPSPRFSPYHGPGRGYPGPQPHFRNNPNYASSQGGYPGSGSNQGRGQWSGNSMSSSASYGRGRGGGRGQGQGQGQGSGHNHVSAEERPDMFYNKSMVEDPWKFLEPVIWKPLLPHKKQWFPHSVSAKKPRVSESPRQQQQSSSEPSLAEIIAASYHGATNEEPSAG